jgi:uncharacterized membrane protein (UPF0127 family)
MALIAPPFRSAPALAALALAACSPQAESAAPAPSMTPYLHAVSGLEVVPLTITQNGRAHRFRVEVAESQQEQWMGLRFRERMAADEGMIFPRFPPRIAAFTMENTQIPLDMVFIGEDGVVDSIIENTTPFEPGPFVSQEPAAAVLELNAGTTARLGIGPGARVDW